MAANCSGIYLGIVGFNTIFLICGENVSKNGLGFCLPFLRLVKKHSKNNFCNFVPFLAFLEIKFSQSSALMSFFSLWGKICLKMVLDFV